MVSALALKYDEVLSRFAFKFDYRLYSEAVHRTVEAFCEVNDLGPEAALQLARGALSRLNPGSILINADPPPNTPGAEAAAGRENLPGDGAGT